MPAELNFFDTYTLMAVQKRIVPKQTFFRDRYFPTERRFPSQRDLRGRNLRR